MKLLKLLSLLSMGILAFAPLACGGDDEGSEAESEGEGECELKDPDCEESGVHWCECCAKGEKCDECEAAQTIDAVAPTLDSTCGDFNALDCATIEGKGYCDAG
jgi:hypothetical protein